MKIALDAMGGDFAPQAIIDGALLASQELTSDQKIVLIGDSDAIQKHVASLPIDQLPENIEVVHASQVITMDDKPTALGQKSDSSISVGYRLLKNREVDAFCSAGNTGAMLVGAVFSVQLIGKLQRPTIISHVPKTDGTYGIVLDVGANTDCKPEMLRQFALIGSLYCKHVFDIDTPKVVLLNVGEEEKKGNKVTQETYQLLKQDNTINFTGNIEGRDLFKPNLADVIVCDGFVGNIVIKMAESYYQILQDKQFSDPFFDNFNFEKIGGSPALGINSNVVIAHGVSNAETIKNVVALAKKMVDSQLHEKIKASMEEVSSS